jgi:phosphoglycolate phosphatase
MTADQCIIFDLDGTLLKVSHRTCQIYEDLLEEHGYSPLPRERYWQLKRSRASLHDILHESGADDLEQTFAQEYLQRVEERRYLSLDTVVPEVVPILGALEGYVRRVLVTLRRRRENLTWQLGQVGLTAQFDDVLSAPSGKEGWQTKMSLIQSLDVQPSHALIVGDTEADVLAGAHLNLPTCAVTYGIRSEEFLQQLRPTYLVNHPLDLIRVILSHIAGG